MFFTIKSKGWHGGILRFSRTGLVGTLLIPILAAVASTALAASPTPSTVPSAQSGTAAPSSGTERYLVFKQNGAGYQVGYIDATGREVIPLRYDCGGVFHDGFAVAHRDGKWWIIDTTGNEKPFEGCDEPPSDFTDGRMPITSDHSFQGFIDTQGKRR